MKKIRPPQLKIRRPQIRTPQIRTPELLNNLYRDLRDRRLLFPAAALLVALIAVPVALSSSSPTTTPPAPAPVEAGSGPAAATEPAVLAEELGVTAYQRRLNQLQTKNPFKRQYMATPTSAQPEASSSTDSPSSSTASSTEDSASTPPSTSTASDASSPPSSTAPPEPAEPTLYVFQLDLAVGPPGDVSRRKHVGLGKFLPSQQKPMFAFAAVAEDLEHALFLVSDDVSSVDGDGRCVPGPSNCRLLRLKVGQEAKLAYAPEGDRTYKLRLHGIDLVPFDGSASDKRGKRGSEFPSGFALAASR